MTLIDYDYWQERAQEDADYADMLYTRGYIKAEDVPCVDDCIYAIENILDAVYKTGDVTQIVGAIDILTKEYELRKPSGIVRITKRISPTYEILKDQITT